MTSLFPVDFHEKITDVQESDRGMGTTQVRFTFDNGWTGSVIQGPYTYGGPDGLFEMAVLDPNGDLNYSNPVTPDDGVGYLSREEVAEKLRHLAFLTNEELAQFKAEKLKKEFLKALEYLAKDFCDVRTTNPAAVSELPDGLRQGVEAILSYFDNQSEEDNE